VRAGLLLFVNMRADGRADHVAGASQAGRRAAKASIFAI
jgi:hypothetical protein